ncbi:helix-turn-helix domain-containing protein [Tepidimonas taiwanensis]|uniref:Virulence regulon transcriptional activator VirF n=1 Tax=Tepidimonas taiwanensis TaxID=307486 RepID=A0A554XDU5_9BURK|nr:helix-turn-helix domain-containing protein [Tepidimonas taiwanensis]TSE34007.1 Virulence regulon transcriptional activator VirF [Tepidimonas taiwanensis]UBQ05016.1 helix-turn-helix domain-containing protein [Tepidimonas taiwanensis]
MEYAACGGGSSFARFRLKRTEDVHVHARQLQSWDQEYEQVSRGPFQGEVRELTAPGLQVFEEWASCATVQYCKPWHGGIWIGLPSTPSYDGLRFMGRSVTDCAAMWASDEQPFDLLVPAAMGLYGVVLDLQDLQQHLSWREGVPSDSAWTADALAAARLHSLGAVQRQRLAGLVREVLRNLEKNPHVLQHRASYHAMHHAIVGMVCDLLVPQASRHSAADEPSHRRRRTLVRRARQLILDRPQDFLHLSQLCAALHVTRRTLHNCFDTVLGISPAAYLREVRLNAVRRALQDPDLAHLSIADVAAQWGFWHMGHFGQEYKALFGEPPSQTRRTAIGRQLCVGQ